MGIMGLFFLSRCRDPSAMVAGDLFRNVYPTVTIPANAFRRIVRR
jgi:hypothetical protein